MARRAVAHTASGRAPRTRRTRREAPPHVRGYTDVVRLAKHESLHAPRALRAMLDAEMRGGLVAARVNDGVIRTMTLTISFVGLTGNQIARRLVSLELYEDDTLRPAGFMTHGSRRYAVVFGPVGRAVSSGRTSRPRCRLNDTDCR